MSWLRLPNLGRGRRLLLFVAFALLPLVEAWGFHRKRCLDRMRKKLGENLSMENDTSVFYTVPATINDPVLTLAACYAECGSETIPYDDIGPRLTTWLLPVIFLLANLQFAPIGKGRFLMVFHLLGDPVDFLFSLLSKVEAWNRCFARAEILYERVQHREKRENEDQVKNLAVIVCALEELMGPLSPSADPAELFTDIFLVPSQAHPNFDDLCWQCAGELVDVRVKEMRRTWLSISLYLFQVVAAFVPKVGGEPSSPPGGRIAFAMLLSSLLSSVLLSNIVGDAVNGRECLRILLRFQKTLQQNGPPQPSALKGLATPVLENAQQNQERSTLISSSEAALRQAAPTSSQPEQIQSLPNAISQAAISSKTPAITESACDKFSNIEDQPSRMRNATSLQDRLNDDDYWTSLAWSGSIYSYRPGKKLFKGGSHDNSPALLAFMSSLPVIIAGVVGMYLQSRSPPYGLTCRHFVIIAAFFCWLISPVLTWFITRITRIDSKQRWYWVLAKDTFFAVPIVALIFGSSCGIFNNCFCFSGFFMYGFEGAHVPLNTDPLYIRNYKTIYPAMVTVCLSLQVFVLPWWMWRTGRTGFRVMRWTEKERMAALRVTWTAPPSSPSRQNSTVPQRSDRNRQDSEAPLFENANPVASPGIELQDLDLGGRPL